MMSYMFTVLTSLLIVLFTGAAIYCLPWKEADLEQLWNDGFRLVYIETQRTQGEVDDFQRLLGSKGSYQQGAGQLAIPLPKPASLTE